MHGCLFDNGYLNVLYGSRDGCLFDDDPGGNGGNHAIPNGRDDLT